MNANETFFRSTAITREKVDEDERTIELAFSSEQPVERAFGSEVLDHSGDSVDLSRLNDGAPLLLEHDRTKQIGVIETARVDGDKVGRAVVRFSKSELGNEIWNDVRDGIRRLVSVGYQVQRFVKEKAEDGVESVRAVDWLPLEVSVVSIPADSSVGIGRAEETTNENENSKIIMSEEIKPEEIRAEAPQEAPQKEVVRVEVKADKRAQDIAALGARFDSGEEAIGFINEGRSADEFKEYLMERKATEPVEAPQQTPEIGMGQSDRRSYSLVKAIREAGAGSLSGLELEAHEAVAKRTQSAPKGFFVPNDILGRDLTATGGDTGDKLVATDLGEFIPALGAQPVVVSLGAKVLSGLSGNVTLPKGGTSTATWADENAAATETTMTLGQVSLSPKRVAAYSDLSKQLLVQASYDVEGIVRGDLLAQLNLAIDSAAINGSGSSGEPTGIVNTASINTVSGYDTRDAAIELETELATDNALNGSPAYLMAPSLRGTFKALAMDSGSGRFVMESSELNGYRAEVSTQAPASTLIFGDFSQLIIGEFGSGVDIVVDPYTLSINGITRIYVSKFADIAVRHADAFGVGS
jgi:HK97 family phage major capsid protein/HK97 family phage prohead protease